MYMTWELFGGVVQGSRKRKPVSDATSGKAQKSSIRTEKLAKTKQQKAKEQIDQLNP